MSRGFLSGVVMGGIVGGIGLALASQMAPPPGTTWPEAQADEALAGTAPDEASRPQVAAEGARKSDTADPDASPAESVSAGARAAQTPGAATDLAPPPGSEFARPLPDAVPVVPSADRAPDRTDVSVVAAPEVPDGGAPDTETAARPQPLPLVPAAPVAPTAEAAAPAVPGLTAATPARSEGAARPGAPAAEADPSAADLPPPPPLTPEEEAMLAEAAGQPAPAEPRRIEPDPPRAPSEASRLPRIGDPAPAAEEEEPPLRRYAQPFENPGRKPLFSILLQDTGGPLLDREALAALPFPVTFVIDPQAPDAATAAGIYRAAGHEVLMLASGLPEGARPADAEVTLESAAAALPEAVGLIDLPAGGFQEARPLSTQVVEILAAQGRGLVTHDHGLNAADQVARREGLPAAVVFRRLDEGEADAASVRRALDRAAFKAAQDGRAMVLGDTRPETLKGLMEWSLEGRADGVALAPATALLR
ncbi:divergent polysaccharide deacteylase family protein [Cereibacter sphaeroides]|uniref:divergent polysaccharide deacteylase family protein n=1 Tax=Cereibacter sphaeroides TaxID=1063 RepID=UPI000191C30A|nr:divergent polysaccharide deacetylase family protein [Cereibacter sphaeroides]ACM00165.1 YibQ protein [Cereibacter sphaeroides KD131]